jgi:peptidoglycan/xylan/chitin deacetylase (PgdA/CDA1 family)
VLAQAKDEGVPMLTFRDLAAGGDPRTGLCLSFDDTSITEWFGMRDLLARYDAHVTFFVTRYASTTPAERQMLHTLYDDGHSVEAHGVNHEHGIAYVTEHGLDAYLTGEVLPVSRSCVPTDSARSRSRIRTENGRPRWTPRFSTTSISFRESAPRRCPVARTSTCVSARARAIRQRSP